jgi:hypothetical protein
MLSPHPFELTVYLGEKFPSVTLDGGLFYSWPLGIRFELGLEGYRERSARLYEALFSPDDICVVIAKDWPDDISPAARQRYFEVFSLPGAFDSNHPLGLQSLEIGKVEDGEQQNSVLHWARLPARSFKYGAIFDGIANADHAKAPSVSSRVYFLNPATDVIVHMYDDRGLDVIAASREPLIPLYRTFNDWILDFDRARIDKALSAGGTKSQVLS